MIKLTEIELAVLDGLLSRVEAERDAMHENDDRGILWDDAAWWIQSVISEQSSDD